MKYLKSTTILLLMLGFSSNVYAQQRSAMQDRQRPQMTQQEPFLRLPDLTDGQREQIRQLRLENREALIPLQNQLLEKQARLRTLTTGSEIDMDAANRVIEEVGALRIDIMKRRLEHRMSIRELLTGEQRVVFDSRRARGMGTHGRGVHHRSMKRGPRGG